MVTGPAESVTRRISGDGLVASQGDGTTEFTGAGPNIFTGGFELGDGAVSSFDGVDQGAKQGFVVVNNSGHLGSGLIRSRGGQLQAGSAGVLEVERTGDDVERPFFRIAFLEQHLARRQLT